MSVTPGTRLGSYEVRAKLGEGGMGEVYRARDTKLGRDVALKILPESFAGDPDRLMRFEREARTLAALNHPNIAAIYGIEESPGAEVRGFGGSEVHGTGITRALVMELVEGEDLSARVARGPIPNDDALSIARQIADALEAAHEAGIIHRDLKPANIKVRDDGTVKVLDFGLAKALDTAVGPGTQDSAPGTPDPGPTMTSPALTRAGIILGTAAYMAPEQARGRPLDRRADIWAFGCVLCEMLTGRRAFQGEDLSMTLAAVMTAEPDLAALPAGVTPAVRMLLDRCLQKDPRQRLRDIGDARLVLQGAFDLSPGPAEGTRALAGGMFAPRHVLAAIALLALGALASWVVVGGLRPPAGESRVVTAQIALPDGTRLSGGHADEARIGGSRPSQRALDWLPDGSALVFSALGNEGMQVYLRPLDSDVAIAIAGTEGGSSPTVSPDGQHVAFMTERGLARVPIAGGTPRILVEQDGDTIVAMPYWMADGTIVFRLVRRSANSRGIFAVPSGGGAPVAVVSSVPDRDGADLRLPAGVGTMGAVLFTAYRASAGWSDAAVYVKPAGGEARRLVDDASDGRVWGDVLLFARRDKLMAVRFNHDTLTIDGDPVVVVDGIVHSVEDANTTIDSGAAQFAASVAGLAVARGGLAVFPLSSVMRVDRSGRSTSLGRRTRRAVHPRVSPSQRQVVYDSTDAEGEQELVVLDVSSGAERVFSLRGLQSNGVWSPDGSRLAFASTHVDGVPRLFIRNADGTGDITPVGTSVFRPDQWVDDDTIVGMPAARGIFTIDIRSGAMREIVPGERWPAVSPDGKWLASSDLSGGIVVRPYPAATPAYRITTAGTRPAWSPDGTRLYFRTGPFDRHTVMEIDVRVADGTFAAGEPREVFTQPYGGTDPHRSYDVFADGTFAMYADRTAESQPVHDIQLMLGMQREVEALLAGRR